MAKLFSVGSLLAVNSVLLISSAATALADTYKTSQNIIVVTGLKPQTRYQVQTTNGRGRNSNRNITTNRCGEVLINNGASYQRLVVDNQTIVTANLPIKTHPRCNASRS
jgi:hypothetical protein